MTTTSRRTVLGLGLAGGAGAVAGCTSRSDPVGATPSPSSSPTESETAVPAAGDLVVPDFDPRDWASVRAQFPLTTDLAQLAAFVLSPHTAQVSAAIDHHRARLDGDTDAALHDGYQLEGAVRRAASSYAGGTADQVALTDSTTMGISVMYGGLHLRPGDEVLTTTHDFFSTDDALRLVSLRTGATVRRVTLYDDPSAATVDQLTSRLLDAIGPATRVVAVTWVHSSTGVRLPVAEYGAALADLNRGRDPADRVLLCVDGVHGFGAVDVDLPDLGCDFLAAGTHKWLFGPRGTGLVWARDWEPLTELIPTFSGTQGGARLSPGGYHDFEHRWALTEAFRFHERIGRRRVVARTVEQATALKDGLAGIDGVTVVTPSAPEVSAGIVCVDVGGMLPADAVLALRELGVVASATPYQQSHLRFGPSIVTTPADVEAAVGAVSQLV
ncbi:aminotransferase class V-fold PLP-dependent enzyme [Nocardioides euryhalodurans]|uniref:Aminotransferase class V-fold PLP-dependent enzyme n=1 Tax=Nocardioides euryhalodurans TaxID=2518370 RepID=A0A4V1BDJ7_9ACTN|nr:aminotransferase class V-fold PLP-dependent enzyme [Nocardioides euryhalodurans]QBR91362.1 aminotransferase class V-fold PLP-dependent enzyme [Nocardioides euryhalodurans]